MFRILSFGHDAALLQTRALILSRAGFEVFTAFDSTQATHVLSGQPIDLLLLCHTLSEQERSNALAVAHTFHRELRALALVDNLTRFTAEGQDAVLSTFDGPHNLVAAVHDLTDIHRLAPPP